MNPVADFLAKERKAIRKAALARRARICTMEGNEKSIGKGFIAFVPSLLAFMVSSPLAGVILLCVGLLPFLMWMGWCVWQFEVVVHERNRRARKILIHERNKVLAKEYREEVN